MANQQEQQQQPPSGAAPSGAPALHPTLVPEILGFSPQMLLDDIISTAAEAILQCIQAMEPFMQRWADARAISPPPPSTSKDKKKGKRGAERDKEREKEDAERDALEAVEQGLVAFSTLLESHTDIAFDFFEAWSMRNIFSLPPDLPIVVPHQRGLDLKPRREEEAELMTDIEDLRRRIENQRRLKRMYLKALRVSRLGRMRAERRIARLNYLSSPLLHSPAPQPTTLSTSTPTPSSINLVTALQTLPPSVLSLFESAASLPHINDPSFATSASTSTPIPDPSKRLWETGQVGYVNWAVQQLMTKAKESAPIPGGSTAVSNAVELTEAVGEMQDVKSLANAVKTEEEQGREDNDRMDTS